MSRFKTISQELDLQSQIDLQSNFDQADADLTSQQQQITTEQQLRITADSAHANATTAHTATQIEYTTGTSVKAKLDAQQAQINNIIGSAGSGNSEIVDARLGADGTARSTLGTLVREIHAQQIETATQSVTLAHGLNII
ncbi:hypothetical protein [Paenibacillus sp. OV219]|uniref:hypothetical protein n=1 Tax=Paenibacillus sp. OV219 TaxID=1884377 RepID=UPI0008BCFD31|nr:hypothetical protein [Paenibacillus sp. OV219]SEM82000.1 hypothetical protein SAMN05518847_101886 [Paenibacillus sp. OV219]